MKRKTLVAGVAVALAATVPAGCGSSHQAATTQPQTTATSTVPPQILSLVAASFPAHLVGSLSFTIDRTHLNPSKPGGFHRRYTVLLHDVTFRLKSVHGRGVTRTASYTVSAAQATFHGFEVLTTSKCETTRIVWHGRQGRRITGALRIYGTKFRSSTSYVFLVPQEGAAATRHCGSSGEPRRNTVIRTASINGNGSLKLSRSGPPEQRFVVMIEVQASTAGSNESGGYTINGSLEPPADASIPVKICTQTGARLKCPKA